MDEHERILMPEHQALHGLRHRWFWQRRTHPYAPVWNRAKLPRDSLPAEENCKLLSLYMRAWTLFADHVSVETPLLTNLRASDETNHTKLTYVSGWNKFIHGEVPSAMQRRYIQNMLVATTARISQDIEETSSDDSDDLDYNRKERHIGDMKVVQQTIDGLAANDEDLGHINVGHHTDTIALGRCLWQTETLTSEELVCLDVAKTKYTMTASCARDIVREHKRVNAQTRTEPFTGATQPRSAVHHKDYILALDNWFTIWRTSKIHPIRNK